MKTTISATTLISALMLAASTLTARADEGDVTFHVKNTLDQTVSIWVASEKSTKANPWAHLDLAADKEGAITLRAPDRFVVAVDIGNQRSRSKPIALKTFLAKHPDYVLTAKFLVQTAGVGLGDASSGGAGKLNYNLDFSAPPKPNDNPEDSKDAKPAAPPEDLDFGFETKPIENNNGNE